MNREHFERLYEEHAQGLYGFLAYRTGDAALAEDLVADTFERVLTSRRPFDRRKGSEKTWIYSIALNRLRDLARRDAAETKALTRAEPVVTNGNGHNGHGNGLEQAETRQVIMAALATLGDDEREALSLRYGADLSLSTIAKVIGKPRSTVEGRIYKGLKHMRAELGGEREGGTSFVGTREEDSAPRR
jgi:RNA polymerase sigma factor (sigma-70 family)